ncbi:ABC transporter ATP-binding protein [Paucihalobacter sp.]|uniref:ABC transporter ATP-binding protein n=1 Tax=Paucihalobacter sp. TaxID=2850405 RepID=UPI002FDFF978
MNSSQSLLNIENLYVSFFNDGVENPILKDISFQLNANEILGIVGESGSGKSVTALSIMGLLPKRIAKITSGNIFYKNTSLVDLNPQELQALRGNEIAMIFQEPMSSLNPSMTCGKQVIEILLQHLKISEKEAKAEVLNLFEKVKLPNPERLYKAYPHEISGGQKQRVMIAMAIACKPKVLIADEPTTALDVTVQAEIISLLKSLQSEYNMSVMFITHDLSLVSEIADRVMVMYQGSIVEQGDVNAIFKSAKHSYTKALIASRPSTKNRLKVLPTIKDVLNGTLKTEIISPAERQRQHENIYSKPPILEVKNVSKIYFGKASLFKNPEQFKAVNDVSFKVYEGETLGLVGESGCGKSTLGNVILQLDKATSGSVFYKGEDITKLNRNAVRQLRKDIQIIFQDPFASLNPRINVGEAILEPMTVHGIGSSKKDRKEKVISLLERVGLSASDFNKYPHQFSGGQRQRVGIARAIVLNPKLIICDESVSALDISVQAQVLNLLNELKEKFNFTYIFISHDLAVVKFMSDQLIVMNQGKIEMIGEADHIYNHPNTPYTKKLIHAIPKGL